MSDVAGTTETRTTLLRSTTNLAALLRPIMGKWRRPPHAAKILQRADPDALSLNFPSSGYTVSSNSVSYIFLIARSDDLGALYGRVGLLTRCRH